MILKNLSTKKVLQPGNALARRDVREGGEFYEEAKIVEARLRGEPGRHFKKSEFPERRQQQALARLATFHPEILCDVMTDNNSDEREYWFQPNNQP